MEKASAQLGYRLESVRRWVQQAAIDDGFEGGTASAYGAVKALEQRTGWAGRDPAEACPIVSVELVLVLLSVRPAQRPSLSDQQPFRRFL